MAKNENRKKTQSQNEAEKNKKARAAASAESAAAAKKEKQKKAKQAVIIAVVTAATVILLLIGALVALLYSMYGEMNQGNVPIVDGSDSMSMDINNPPNIIGDETGIPPLDTDEGPVSPGTVIPGDDTREPYEDGEPTEYVGDIPIYRRNQIDPNVLNILVVGRDKEGVYGRADSSMIISYNKKTKSVKIVSVLRDSYVPININGGIWNKFGHSLSYGGMGLTINTVNDLLNLDIQNYAVVDFNGLETIVNRIGGIDVTFTKDEAALYNLWFGKQLYRAGTNHLNGDMALRHARNRSIGSDFERTRRQRDVLQAIYNKIFSMGMTEGMKVVREALSLITTNISFNTCISLATDVFTSGGVNITTDHMPFDDTWKYAQVKQPGASAAMSVVQIDIEKNREAIWNYLYGR